MNPRQKRINTALAAVLLAQGIPDDEVCKRVGAKNMDSLGVSLNSKGVTITACRAMSVNTQAALTPKSPQVLKLAGLACEALKDTLGTSTLSAAKKLASAKLGGSVKAIRAYAEALEPLSRVGDRLYGWSASSGPTWNVTVLDFAAGSCVSDTPTSGMPEQKQLESSIQSSDVVDIQEVSKPTV